MRYLFLLWEQGTFNTELYEVKELHNRETIKNINKFSVEM